MNHFRSQILNDFASGAPPLGHATITSRLRNVLEMPRSKETRSNRMRQTQAPLTRVSLVPHGRSMLLEIADDGVEFDPEHVKGDSLGLRNLRSHAQHIGAQLETLSKPGEGTRIVADIRFPHDNR